MSGDATSKATDTASGSKNDDKNSQNMASSDTSPDHADRVAAEAPQVEATPVAGSNLEDVKEVVDRGRSFSRESHVSRSSHSHESRYSTSDDEHSGNDHQVAVHRTRSRGALSRTSTRAQSSVRSVAREAVAVPLNERRGLLARVTLLAEVTEPYAYSRKMKWLITFIIAIAGAAAPMGSSLILPALSDIMRTFNSTATIVNLSVAFYMLSMSIFPLWWSSFSETLGRRTIYLTSFALFLLFNILTAVSTSIGMFVAMRMLSGGAAASVQAVGAGTIADIWEVRERGRAMGIFYLGPLCGPLLSPIIGGLFAQTLGWRSAQWFLSGFSAALLFLILFFLPETLRQRKSIAAEAAAEAVTKETVDNEKALTDEPARPQLARTSTRQSVKVKSTKYLVMLRRAFIDPLRIILYLKFPAVAWCVYYSSITFGTLYMLNISIQRTFERSPYNYGSIIVGLLYLPNSVGYFLASIFGGRWVDQIMYREAVAAARYDDRGKLVFIPEDRMKENAWIGAALWPTAIIIYGWTAKYGVNIAVPMVANFFFGIGSMLIFALVTTMLTEFMPRKASNGVALNNFCRNICTCIGVIVADPLLNAIGDGWLFTGLGVISLVSGFASIAIIKHNGPKWRIVMNEKMEKAMGD